MLCFRYSDKDYMYIILFYFFSKYFEIGMSISVFLYKEIEI